jgi:hypothetical protein
MNLEEQRLAAVRMILLEHKGKNNSIRASKIGHILNIPENDTFSTTRALITRLILEDGLPIAANAKGYFYIENEAELSDYMQYLQDRIHQTTNRMITVYSNYQIRYGKTRPIRSGES